MTTNAEEITMTTEPTRPPVGTSAGADYDRLLTEATAIAYRIADQLANGEFPKGLDWGHVGGMGETVRGLRAISDRMFAEGEYAPENQ